MSQDEFKSIRITLSEEAFERLERIMKKASFRSYSSTIEECIRVVYELVYDIKAAFGSDSSELAEEQVHQLFSTIIARMTRFTNLTVRRKD